MKTCLPILILAFLLLFSGCRKEQPDSVRPNDDPTQLPAETQTGKNTFGCLVNGQAWRDKGTNSFGASNPQASHYKDAFHVSASKEIGQIKEGIGIQIISKFVGKGIYQLNTDFFSNGKRVGLYNRSDLATKMDCSYYTDPINTGILEITHFDSINYIVAGRFSFTVATAGCDTVRITDGRFDIKYAY